ETCIKGHRSSACKHTDRPLFEIKKKGRPVTQCEHCRELRKTKQVHVKCICEPKSDYQQGVAFYASHRSGPKPGFESAAFPTGLPPALGASVAFPNSVDGASSDSDPGGMQLLARRHLPR
ncbi:transcription factor, partial [Pholiota conissans]